TKAILPVHLWGLAADMDPIVKTAKQNGLFVVEDCAQAAGADYKGKKAGSLGNAGCFSFFPTKNLGAYGDGGMIVTDDKKIYDRIKLLHLHGSKTRGVHEAIGYNSRLDELQAAVLRVKLRHLDEWNGKRRANAMIYSSLFEKNGIKHPVEKEDFKHVYHQYTIEVDGRDNMMQKLSAKEIPSFVYYSNPLHLQKAYSGLGCKSGDFPVAEKIGKTMLSIPIHPFLSKEEVSMIGEAIINSR
ncbi:MAG: DegT/DnrJ/EryC1/StrS family aminotransferase, partial [Candidatus Margulisiibacteriota bacterium]